MITIDKTFNGKTVEGKKGDVIKVQLTENPTTGYLWDIKFLNDKHLHLTEKHYETTGNTIGSGGTKDIYLEIIAKGSSELQLTLRNPWEHDTVDTFQITIES